MESGIEKNMGKITSCIFIFRDEKVIFDSDLASIYGVDTKSLKRAVKRNSKRFPPDFMFQLTREEFLRCQNYTSSWGGTRYLPLVFTEHGAVMLASVLNSSAAIEASIYLVRAFIKLREIISIKLDLSEKIKELELKTFEIRYPPSYSTTRLTLTRASNTK